MAAEFAPYRKLAKRAREIAWVASASELLSWDLETYMPPKALGFRAEQLAHLGGHTHKQFTSKIVGDWLKACEEHGFAPDSPEGVNVREWRRLYDRATKLPARFVEKFQRIRTHAREAWKEARKQSRFKLFKPHLERVVALNQQRADYWGYTESPYDALLEEFEPGMRSSQVKKLFSELRPGIVEVLGPARERSASVPADLLEGDYPEAAQQALNRKVAEALGFDFQGGRIDTTTHPFCTGLGVGDCRLTTRYNERNFTQSLYGIMHEAGHGMYDQGLPAEYYGQPLGTAVSLGIHESQSRLWENHVGRHPAFWEHWHPIACEHFPALRRLTAAQVAAAVNRVTPSFIRVEADQVTYDLHIILRFEVEVRLLEKQLAAADVPGYWNEQFEKMLGLKVQKDSDGCLQDIHWSLGDLGYFATYTLGNLNAAQFMRRALSDNPGLEAELARGEYGKLLAWLRQNVHRHGMRYHSQELMEQATGERTGIAAHLDYLRKKFLS